jgi:hypothetical protein
MKYSIVKSLKYYFSETKNILRLLKVFIPGYLALQSVSWFWKDQLLVLAILAIVSIFYLYNLRKRLWVVYFFAALFGALAENMAIKSGAWAYSQSGMEIPLWLPLLWGMASIFILKMSDETALFIDNYYLKARL